MWYFPEGVEHNGKNRIFVQHPNYWKTQLKFLGATTGKTQLYSNGAPERSTSTLRDDPRTNERFRQKSVKV